MEPFLLSDVGILAGKETPVQPSPRTVKETFNAIQVIPFDIQKDVTFPTEYLAALQTEISKQLVSAKVFAEVVPAGQTPTVPSPHPRSSSLEKIGPVRRRSSIMNRPTVTASQV